MNSRTAIGAILALSLLGCSPAVKKEALIDEAKALQGGPMPPGTWEKIAAQKAEFEKKNGTSASPSVPAERSDKG